MDNVEVDIAMQYTADDICRIHSYANNINTLMVVHTKKHLNQDLRK